MIGLMEAALYLVMLPPVALVVFDSLCRLAFLMIALLPWHEDAGQARSSKLRLLLLVVAHDEEHAIERTLKALMEQANGEPAFTVAVLADYCGDRTGAIAEGMGARVYGRAEGRAGKAEALSWFARAAREVLSEADIIVVLDADSLVEEGFCEQIRRAFGAGVEVVQGYIHPESRDGFPVTTLVSFSEILSERIDDAARSRLGWSVPLRGTGMAFRSETFIRACEGLGTQVDDIELSVRLAELGIRVDFEPRAVVRDPKSSRAIGLARQRGRWLKGQRQVWRTRERSILKLLRAGLPNWSLIQGMLLKPKTALAAARVLLAALLWAWPFPRALLHDVMFWAVAGSVVADVLYYIVGVRFTREPGKYLAALLASPALLVLWALSWGYSLLPTQDWLRADED